MRAPLALSLTALLLLAGGLAGCIEGKVFPAEIPQGNLAPQWSYDSQNSFSGVAGQEPIVKAHYRVNVYAKSATAAVFVISVADVPLLDVQKIITEQLDKFLLEQGIATTFHNRGTGSISGQAVEFSVSDATRSAVGGSAKGFAIDIPYKCAANGQFVRVFGYASTQTNLLGRSFESRESWEQLAGQADKGTLGGMVTAVKCA